MTVSIVRREVSSMKAKLADIQVWRKKAEERERG
jgi:hypothetical protein